MILPIQPEGRRGVLSRAAAHILNTTATAWSLAALPRGGQIRPEPRDVFADFLPRPVNRIVWNASMPELQPQYERGIRIG